MEERQGLFNLNYREVFGIVGLEVKFDNINRNTESEGIILSVIDAYTRNLREQSGFDTRVVWDVNDEN